jgi:hypothetical protein
MAQPLEVHFIGGPRDGEVLAVPAEQRALEFAIDNGDGTFRRLVLPIEKWRDDAGRRAWKVDGTQLPA